VNVFSATPVPLAKTLRRDEVDAGSFVSFGEIHSSCDAPIAKSRKAC